MAGRKVSEEEIVSDIEKAMPKIINDFANGEIEPNAEFVIQNKKTKQIVEIKARSAFHAASIVGWRPRHVKLIQANESSED